MKPYRYILQPYKGINSRYHCPACNHRSKTFKRYIDTDTGNYLASHVGKCDREINCGYHYTPKQYFAEHTLIDTAAKPLRIPKRVQLPGYIPQAMFAQTLQGYGNNHFVQFLQARFGSEVTHALIQRYHIGSSKLWHGATIFWQVDAQGSVRTGKIMLYDAGTGKRIKQPHNHISWVHTQKDKQGKAIFKDYDLRQCFFGAHLLQQEPGKDVAIVESEKTAIIASVYLPQFIWLASGSKEGLNETKCRVLKGRQVTLYPDLQCYQRWQEKGQELFGDNYSMSTLLEEKATDADRTHGFDLGDYLLRA